MEPMRVWCPQKLSPGSLHSCKAAGETLHLAVKGPYAAMGGQDQGPEACGADPHQR